MALSGSEEPASGYHFSSVYPPPAKRRRLNPGIYPYYSRDPYTRLLLEKDRCIYLTEEDAYHVLTPLWVEWNPAIRRAIGRLPRGIHRRLLYLARFHRETAIYHPFEDILLVEHLQDQLYGAYLRESRLKRAMRNLWGRWKTWRMDQRYDVEWSNGAVDPITLDPPLLPVTIYSWTQRRRYTFDAKSISLHIEAQLTHHSGGFPVPKSPRNPWINTEFTLRELISLFLQLQRLGEIRWAFQTFRTAQFDLTRWGKEQRVLLVRRSLEDATKNLRHWPFLQQSVLEFIVKTLEDHDAERWETIYRYALEHHSEHPVVLQWAKWYVEAHVPNGASTVVIIDLKKIEKRQQQLERVILRETR